MKSIVSIIIMLAVIAMGATASAHHQTAGTPPVTIMHTSADVPGYDETTNLNYEGNMTVAEANGLLTTATQGSAVILDVRTAWERRGDVCPMQLAIGMEIDP